MAGLKYEGDPNDGGEIYDVLRCSVHGGYEMFHTCAGGPGEPLGYCSAAPDTRSCSFEPSTKENPTG